MQKKLLLAVSLCMLGVLSFSQSTDEKELLDKMSKAACKKIEKADIRNSDDAAQIQAKLGMALLPVLQDNQAEIKKVWNLDITVPGDAEQIGEKLGQYAIYDCPRFLEVTTLMLKKDSGLADRVNQKLNGSGNAAEPDEVITGKISKIEGNDVSYIYVNTDEGETIRLMWLEDFEGSRLLTDGGYTDTHFSLQYKKKSIYQPQTKSYKDVKVITGLAKA